MTSTQKIVRIALLSALSFVLMFFVHFPLPGFPTYLKYDPSEIPALIGTFSLGPMAGVVIQIVKNLLFLLSGRSEAGLVGVAANFTAGGSMVLVAGLVYQWRRTRGGAILALITASLITPIVMALANYHFFFPVYGIPKEAAAPLITSVVVPFNLIKTGMSSLGTFVLYKKTCKILGLERDGIPSRVPVMERTGR